MSDGESPTPAPRPRPSYGLPGPVPSAQDAPGPWTGAGQTGAAPQGYQGHQGYQGQQGHEGPQAQQGPHGPWSPTLGVPAAPPAPPAGTAPQKRRGLVMLVVGLVLLLLVGPAATVIGLVTSLGSLAGDASQGPTVMTGSSVELELPAREMVILYVPAEDAGTAQCTAESSVPGALTTVPSSTPTTFGDGSEYVQVLGVASLEDATVTLSCTGTDAPAHLGPYSMLGMMGPLVIGPLVGLVAGLTGLVLTIIGIVRLTRSRRA